MCLEYGSRHTSWVGSLQGKSNGTRRGLIDHKYLFQVNRLKSEIRVAMEIQCKLERNAKLLSFQLQIPPKDSWGTQSTAIFSLDSSCIVFISPFSNLISFLKKWIKFSDFHATGSQSSVPSSDRLEKRQSLPCKRNAVFLHLLVIVLFLNGIRCSF